MKKQFVTKKIALALKDIGFDEPCIARFSNSSNELILLSQKFGKDVYTVSNSKSIELFSGDVVSPIAAPLWQQVIDWFIENHDINCVVGYTDDNEKDFMAIIDRPNQGIDYDMNSTKNHRKAREKSVLKAIEIIKSK